MVFMRVEKEVTYILAEKIGKFVHRKGINTRRTKNE